MGQDEDFEGLRPDWEVGKDDLPPAETGEDVVLEPLFPASRGRRGGRSACASNRGGERSTRGRRGGRGSHQGPQPVEAEASSGSAEDEEAEEERLFRGDISAEREGRRRTKSQNEHRGSKNIQQRHHSKEESHRNKATSSNDVSSKVENSSLDSNSNYSRSIKDDEVQCLAKCGLALLNFVGTESF